MSFLSDQWNRYLKRRKERLAKLEQIERTVFNGRLYDIKYIIRAKRAKYSTLRRYLVLAAVGVAVFFGLRAFFNSRKAIEYVSPPPAVAVIRPEKGSIVRSVSLNAYVEPSSVVPVVPFVAGTITDYCVKEGDYVEEGDLLAQIDDEPYLEQASQAEAAYSGYLATYRRVKSLYEQSVASAQDYDTVKAQKEAYEAQYNLAMIQLGYASVTAPVSGTVLKAPLSVGSPAATTIPVAVLTDLGDLVVKAQVPEKYFEIFRTSRDSVRARVTRPSQTGGDFVCDAEIRTVSPLIEAKAKTFEVTLSLGESSERFRPGMFVKVRLDYDMVEDVMVIPQKAKKNDGSVYMYDEGSGTVSWLENTGFAEDDKFLQVPDEYAAGFFVIEGQNKIFDGQEVKVVDAVAINGGGN